MSHINNMGHMMFEEQQCHKLFSINLVNDFSFIDTTSILVDKNLTRKGVYHECKKKKN